MTRLFEDRVVESWQDRDSGRSFVDLEFRRCRFVFSSVTATRDPGRRQTVRNVKLVDCVSDACHIGGVILEDVTIEGLRTAGVLRVTASALKHVVLSGPIDEVMVHPNLWPGPVKEGQQSAFDEANDTYYRSVDWAIDISNAEFREAEIQGIPARLVKRDPTTQFVVTREKAMIGLWKRLDLAGTPWAGAIQFLIDDGYSDKLLIAPKRNPGFEVLRAGLMRLREAGVAEPN